jgi:antitoxin VapB
MAMPLNIRDPRAQKLAKDLARRRGTTMTAVIVEALEKETHQEAEKTPLAARLKAIAATREELQRPGGRRMTKAEIDALWGHE